MIRFVALLLVAGVVGCMPAEPPGAAPCTPLDPELEQLARECEARVLRDCGRPPAESCPTLIECDRLGREHCK